MISNSQMLSLPSQHSLVSSSNDHHHETLDHLFSSDSHSSSLLYNLSILKEKLHQIQSAVNIAIYNHQNSTEPLPPPRPLPQSHVATTTINSLIQELFMAASSMLFTCQQMNNLAVNSSLCHDIVDNDLGDQQHHHREGLVDGDHRSTTLFDMAGDHHNWYNTTTTYNNNNHNNNSRTTTMTTTTTTTQDHRISIDIVELGASDLLAKYTHYCQICGKGFKRDANLRMHMRAHGDEYKTSGALSNRETKSHGRDSKIISKIGTKYSCPQEGCRWNQKHAKFQPLKSLICVKNHYKRTHCPKMYVCKLCSRKKFSVLSDLRTHEKHCGDVKWLCSCGTTFSRKDKLMGHVDLFVGHVPATGSSTKCFGKQEEHQYVNSF